MDQLKRKLLYIELKVPETKADSGSIDAFNYMRAMVHAGIEVTFAAYLTPIKDSVNVKKVIDLGINIIHGPADDLDDWIKTQADSFDYVVVSRPEIGKRLLSQGRAWCSKSRLIYNTVDLHHVRFATQAVIENNDSLAEQARAMKDDELRYCSEADAVVVVSLEEKSTLIEAGVITAEKILVWPLLRDIEGRAKGHQGRNGIVFIGGFSHAPNMDAVTWLINDIWPEVLKRIPNLSLTVIGSNLPPQLLAYSENNVHVLGQVDDLTPYFDGALASIAPLRFGAGLKGKIVTSLSYGVPVVTTDIGSEGFLKHPSGNGLCVGNSVEELVDHIVKLCGDPAFWNSKSLSGLSAVFKAFNFEAASSKVTSDLFSLISDTNIQNSTLHLRKYCNNQIYSITANNNSANITSYTESIIAAILNEATAIATLHKCSPIDLLLNAIQFDDSWQIYSAIADLYHLQGNYHKAVFFSEKALAINHYDVRTQNRLLQSRSLLEGDNYYDDTIKYLEYHRCKRPSQWIELGSNATWSCCASWLPRPIGSGKDVEADLNGVERLSIKESVDNGSYSYCSKLHCPFIANRKLTPSLNYSSEIFNGKTVNLCYDDSCNLSCPSCRSKPIYNTPEAVSSLNQYFTSTVEPLLSKNDVINITGSGDPFYSKHFRWVIESLKNRKDIQIDLQTNGVLADSKNLDKLFDSNIGQVWVSIDAATEETYNLIRLGGDFKRLLSNVLYFIDLRTKKKINFVGLDFVVQAENIHEVTDIVVLANSLGIDKVRFNMIRNWGTFDPETFFVSCPGLYFSPLRREFINQFTSTILNTAKVDFGNITAYLPKILNSQLVHHEKSEMHT